MSEDIANMHKFHFHAFRVWKPCDGCASHFRLILNNLTKPSKVLEVRSKSFEHTISTVTL